MIYYMYPNIRVILGYDWENGKEHGNYCGELGKGSCGVGLHFRITEKNMEAIKL